ncbi:MAG TPA: NAD-dependent epimerase/dehydratase family protein [Flavipsychrobacter sp.]
MGIRVIITGATGMVGKGVLLECLEDENISEVLLVNRQPIGMQHPKLKELIHKDFYDLSAIKEQLQGYDACFFCLGVSAIGMSEEQYIRVTYDLTIHFAETIAHPGMTFIYVSGTGTDSTEQGRTMWARVKGRTENALLKMPFKAAFMFRPGIILPMKGIKSKTGWYNAAYVVLRPFFPLMRKSASVTDTIRVGKAMIKVALHGSDKNHLENRDINGVAERG